MRVLKIDPRVGAIVSKRCADTPTPNPSPQGGRERVALLSLDLESTTRSSLPPSPPPCGEVDVRTTAGGGAGAIGPERGVPPTPSPQAQGRRCAGSGGVGWRRHGRKGRALTPPRT